MSLRRKNLRLVVVLACVAVALYGGYMYTMLTR